MTLRTFVLATLLASGIAYGGLAGSVVLAAEPPAVPAVIDQAAIDALGRMGAFLRTLTTFEVVATTEIDEVMENGEKLQLGGTTTYKVRRPDRMFVQLVGDRKVRQFYYDGATVTVAAPRMGYYAVVDAPATIGAMIDVARDTYAIEIPLADLFRWGTEKIPAEVVEGARTVGYARIGGVDTDHYAFRGAEVDWQIWIQRGEKPFPVKVVITSKTDAQSPQYTAELTWTELASLADDTFKFIPPAGAAQITIAGATDAAAQTKGTTP